MSAGFKSLDKRVKALEDSMGSKSESKSESKTVKVKKPPSEYNNFMKKYISDEKEKGTTKSHADIFSAGAKAWTLQKK